MIILSKDTVENTEISSSDSCFVGFAGEIKLSTIQKNVKRMMREDFSLFSLGIGFDVDFDFLERIATENRGVAQRIFANKDAAEQLRVRRLFELLDHMFWNVLWGSGTDASSFLFRCRPSTSRCLLPC